MMLLETVTIRLPQYSLREANEIVNSITEPNELKLEVDYGDGNAYVFHKIDSKEAEMDNHIPLANLEEEGEFVCKEQLTALVLGQMNWKGREDFSELKSILKEKKIDYKHQMSIMRM